MNGITIAVIVGIAGLVVVLVVAARMDQQARNRTGTAPNRNSGIPSFVASMTPERAAEMYRSMGSSAFGFGILLLIMGGGDVITGLFAIFFIPGVPLVVPPGVLFIAVGLLLIIYREPSSMGVAGVIVILGSLGLLFVPISTGLPTKIFRGLLILGLLYGYPAFRGLVRRYPDLPDSLKPEMYPQRTGDKYPLWSLICGLLALGSTGLLFVWEILTPGPSTLNADGLTFFSRMVTLVAVPAVALGVISLNEGFPRKSFSVIGLICGAIPVAGGYLNMIVRGPGAL